MSNITKKIKTFEDACKYLKRNATLPDFSMIPEKDKNSLIAHYKLTIICEALNEGKLPNWSDGKWNKWYPYFYMDDSSASGRFSFYGSDFRCSDSAVGSRLCYNSEELSDYAAKQFEDLYRQYFVVE
ncbi:hypothetical protein [Chryseobacterium terrae]|uniref:Uncharacterized protein n=1 Tax=Chryseobacterium terrae TaxID=3163299 RepID=A0ABW8Y662_9FLAO